jgi:hypothetical protein
MEDWRMTQRNEAMKLIGAVGNEKDTDLFTCSAYKMDG